MKYSEIFSKVNKPARYTGDEYNSCNFLKPHSLSFCLCFPEPYEIAMSNLGMKILYHMLNGREDTVCERCFFPWTDFSALLKQNNIPLFSIESKKALKDFDIIGFSIHHELCYTNILHMLKLADIPFYSRSRSDDMPLVIAGGPCSINPEPYAEFFDIIIIGEAENALYDLCSLYIEYKESNKSFNRNDFFKQAANIEGVYIPSFMHVEYDEKGNIAKLITSYNVKRAFVKDINKSFYPAALIVPNLEAVHDRGVLELYRGCSNGCRFCQAGFVTRPLRHKSADVLVRQAEDMLKSTGFEEISLSSLSTGDYPQLKELIDRLNYLKCEGTTFSLPSLRLSGYLKDFASSANVTFAPEAATQRLRNVINKNITDDDIDGAFEEAFSLGQNNIKLYFMCGLPTETEQDILHIADIVNRAKQIYSKYNAKSCLKISVSCAVFIPKPFTPFQWEKMEERQSIENKQKILGNLLKKLNVKYNYHDYNTSVIEAVFSRGDRRLCEVIEKAYKSGCMLDNWSEFFDYGKWQRAFEECGIDISYYLDEIEIERILPWDFFDCGIKKEYLLNERENAYKAAATRDCRRGCNRCGAQAMYCDIANKSVQN